MNIGIQTWGSDGDILPIMAMAGGLSAAGHEVTVGITSVDNKDYSALADSLNLKLLKVNEPFSVNMEAFFEEVMKTADQVKQLGLVLGKYFDPVAEEMYEASTSLCRENDLVVGHFFNHTLLTAAEQQKRPRVSVALSPGVVRTKHISPLGTNLGTLLNKVIWNIGDRLIRKKCFQAAAAIREREGMPPVRSLGKELYISRDLTLVAVSRALCSPQPDWGEHIQQCGFLNLPSVVPEWEMPGDLEHFLERGEPPVYLTFGSCTQFDPDATHQLFVKAIQRTGRRAIIQSGRKGDSPINEDPDIYHVERIPHRHIFPFCSMIVHHGGAGTTQSALLSGNPSLVVEHAFDQSYWGKQLKRRGVAGELLHRRSLTAEKLAHGIDAVLSQPRLRQNARQLGDIMRKEDGVRKAVQLIEERFGRGL